MKRLATAAIACAALGLALAPAASARVLEIGSGFPSLGPSCPGSATDPCTVIARTTGYNSQVGRARSPFVVTQSGTIVGWSIVLAKPTAEQVDYFNRTFAGAARARLQILRKGRRRTTRLTHRLVAQSPLVRLDRYFGSTPTFALDRPIKVRPGNIVAIGVTTWAPAFGARAGRDNTWLSSFHKVPTATAQEGGPCGNRTLAQRATQTTIGALRKYECRYRNARLMYSATFIPDPRPTSE
jgi:hypothetical protein